MYGVWGGGMGGGCKNRVAIFILEINSSCRKMFLSTCTILSHHVHIQPIVNLVVSRTHLLMFTCVRVHYVYVYILQ